jgi:hypothetical protein
VPVVQAGGEQFTDAKWLRSATKSARLIQSSPTPAAARATV